VKLTGRDLPETLDTIDALWKRAGEPRPIRRQFVDEYLQNKYTDVVRQQHFIGGLCLTAIVVACLGLFGLSASTTEQRIKEIGVRKSMGATRGDILRLLLWQFAKPVVAANVIAWPAAYLVMQHWLEGFAYHIELKLWMFAAASALALGIALSTVIGHALLVARAHPVDALRYE
jgi:putative ABC transport system permease protein